MPHDRGTEKALASIADGAGNSQRRLRTTGPCDALHDPPARAS